MEKKRALINIFINRIYLYDDHYTLILNGGNRGVELENIPIEILDSSAFNGISEQIRCSPLVADAPTKKKLGNRTDRNAARMSAAGDGSTEPLLNFCPGGKNANRFPSVSYIYLSELLK